MKFILNYRTELSIFLLVPIHALWWYRFADTIKNGKLGMSVTGSAKEATDHVPCEVVYPNGVILRIQSELSLEALRSLILLCR